MSRGKNTNAQATRRSPYSQRIKTVNDLLKDKDLVAKFQSIFSDKDGIRRGHAYKIPTDERNDDFIALLIELELASYDWDELKKQKHRQVGNRIIELYFDANPILDIFDRLNGKGAIIRKQTLEYISRRLGEMYTGNELIGLLQEWGVPDTLIEYPNTKWRMVNTILTFYATSKEREDRAMLSKIIEEAVHPLAYGGDENAAEQATDEFNKRLKYDDFQIKNGALFQNIDHDRWMDGKGEVHEPKTYRVELGEISGLYLYWNELIKLVRFYFANLDAQTDEINELYFQIIQTIEEILWTNKCGNLRDIYRKPFKNLFGCEFEIKKNGKTSEELLIELYDFLGKITDTSLPYQFAIEDYKEEGAELLGKVKRYMETHRPAPIAPISEKHQPTEIRIVEMPELRIKATDAKPPIKSSLKIKTVVFDEAQSAILVDGKVCPLPPAKNEEYLAKAMFSRPIGEFVDWSIVHKEITGATAVIGSEKDKKSVRDTMDRLNKRLQTIIGTSDQLLRWQNKSICRNF